MAAGRLILDVSFFGNRDTPGKFPGAFGEMGMAEIFGASPTAPSGLIAIAGAAGVGGRMLAGFKGTGAIGVVGAPPTTLGGLMGMDGAVGGKIPAGFKGIGVPGFSARHRRRRAA